MSDTVLTLIKLRAIEDDQNIAGLRLEQKKKSFQTIVCSRFARLKEAR